MKKFLAILLSAVLMLSLTVPSMAADDEPVMYTITVPSTDTHTYEVYQIFTGDFYNGILSNLVWGENGRGYVENAEKQEKVPADVLSALQAVTNDPSDKAKLAVIDDYVNFSSDKHGSVNSASPLSVVPGYYLLKDADNSLDGADDAYTTYIVQIVDNVNVARKASKPSVDKQVKDEVDDKDFNSTDTVEGWGETADHAINESFQFKLIATLPADEDFNAYEKYTVVFNDTMSTGITFESIESVTVDDVPLTAYTCSATGNQAGGDWTLTIENIKIAGVNLADGAEVVVIYNAHLNANAVIGNIDDNLNKVYLEYSNNPNAGGEEDLGKTPEDIVWVFTYEMDNTKTDNNNQPLKGATFAIKNAAGQYYGGVVNGVVTWVGSPDPVNDTDVYKVTSNDQGVFTVKGLDVGTYILTEIVTPAGYNTCADVTVVISAVHKELDKDNAETTITMTKDGEPANKITVINQKGATLPETGGIGTTIFYAVGGVMVAAAAILLITKKRMSTEG